MILVIIQSNLAIVQCHQDALHRVHLADICDLSWHLLSEVDSSLVEERVDVAIHGRQDDSLLELDQANRFGFDMDHKPG